MDLKREYLMQTYIVSLCRRDNDESLESHYVAATDILAVHAAFNHGNMVSRSGESLVRVIVFSFYLAPIDRDGEVHSVRDRVLYDSDDLETSLIEEKLFYLVSR